MISMIWISQSASRFAETEFFAPMLMAGLIVCLVLNLVLNRKGDQESLVAGLIQYLIAFCLCIYSSFSIWKKSTTPRVDRRAVRPKKPKKKAKENPPILIENIKKKDARRKGRRAVKKSFCKENKEPTVTKRETTKMYPSLDACRRLEMDSDSIYNCMHQLVLTDHQLKDNNFPNDEGYKPTMQVEANDSNRKCARCSSNFKILLDGTYVADSSCSYHPRRARFMDHHHSKLYECCGGGLGSEPCATSMLHVTVQHRQRSFVKTSSRRHVKKELQNSIFALDCEMSYTTDGLEIVRVGLVNLNGVPVVDMFVKPHNEILDYNTMFSGVSKADMDTAKLTIDDARRIVIRHIHEDSVLIGHAINNDLAALGLIHRNVVDTSVLYADPENPRKKPALKTLAALHLGMTIQGSPSGHDCIDDARASLQLALLKIPASAPQNVAPKKHTNAQRRAMQPACERRPFAEMQLSNTGRAIVTEKPTVSHSRSQTLSHSSNPHTNSTFGRPLSFIAPCNKIFQTPSGVCVPQLGCDGSTYFSYYGNNDKYFYPYF